MRYRQLTGALLAAAACAACASHPAGTIDMKLVGGEVVTFDAAHPGATALAITGPSVVALDEEARGRDAGPDTTLINLDGAVVVPALVDHHVHLFNLGLALLNDRDGGRLLLDLADATTLEDVGARVRARAETIPAGTWIVGGGWSQASWGTQALPTHEVLTRAAPDHPVYLARVDAHAGWVNARALELAGISARTADPYGGVISRAPGGVPSGILLERANELVTPLIPALADADVIAAFQLAAEALAARGVVEVYDAGVLPVPGLVALNADFGRFLRLLREADARKPLPLRVNLMIPAPSTLADDVLASPVSERTLSPRVRVTHLKLFADGALGSRGAALTHPYADDPHTSGVPRMSTEEMTALALRATDAGLGVAIHAIGDEAVTRALDACEAAIGQRPDLDRARLRIEHFSYARESDFARAVALGVVLSIQSNFNSMPEDDPTFGAMRVGVANEPRVYAWDRLERMGARLAEGSDYFTRPAEALAGYVAALTRRGAVGPGRPDGEARLLAYRMQATLFPPSGPPRLPVIGPGAPADLVILSANPLTTARDELAAIEVLATVSAGSLVYVAEPFRARIARAADVAGR